MRVLFLNPPVGKGELYMKELGRCGRKSVAGELWPQTGLAYLAAMVMKEGGEAEIIDAIADRSTITDIINKCQKFNPDLLIIGTTTPTFANDSKVATEIKASKGNMLIGFCGTHASALPEEVLKTSVADFVLINEAEETVGEIARLKPLTLKSLKNINGVGIKINGEIHFAPPRGLVEDLDTLPFPARHLLPNDKYKMPFFAGKSFATIIPTRGCPYQCVFCRAGTVWGNRVRTRSPQNVLAEVEEVVNKLKMHNIVFMTDSLTLKRGWTRELCNEIINRKIKIRWICNSRVDAIDLDTLKLMRKAGCRLISFGVESGNQVILNTARKGTTLEQAERAIALTKKAKIITMAYFIIGLPGETQNTIKDSIEFAKEINPDYVNFHVATPFPGTEFYEIAKKNGWLTSTDWSDYEEEGSAVIRTAELTAEELVAAQKRAMREFYLRPRSIIKQIAALRSPSQFASRVKAGLKVMSTFFRE